MLVLHLMQKYTLVSLVLPCAQFDLAGSARIEVLISAIEPRQASQIVKELTELLPLEQAKVSG